MECYRRQKTRCANKVAESSRCWGLGAQEDRRGGCGRVESKGSTQQLCKSQGHKAVRRNRNRNTFRIKSLTDAHQCAFSLHLNLTKLWYFFFLSPSKQHNTLSLNLFALRREARLESRVMILSCAKDRGILESMLDAHSLLSWPHSVRSTWLKHKSISLRWEEETDSRSWYFGSWWPSEKHWSGRSGFHGSFPKHVH